MARTSKRRTKKKSNDSKVSDKSVVIGKNERKTRIKTEPISRSSDGSDVVSTPSVKTPTVKTPPVGSKSKRRKTRVKTEPKSPSTDELGSAVASTSKTTSVKTPSVASTPRGRPRKSNKLKVDSKIFSQKEKKLFYECLKQNGISCLNDETTLKQLFPNRSITEIKAMIDNFSRRAQEMNRKNEENLSDIQTSDPNANKPSIEKWFEVIHQLVPPTSKKDDVSAILVDFFDIYLSSSPLEVESEEHNLRPNYRAVYDCIRDALNGKYPKQMEPIDAFVVVKLIEELKEMVKSDTNKNEMAFLKSGLWWQISNETNAKPNGDVFKAIHSLRQRQNEDNDTTGDVESIDPNEDNSYERVRNFPKLRKIIECLNPLRVPIELTANEYNRH